MTDETTPKDRGGLLRWLRLEEPVAVRNAAASAVALAGLFGVQLSEGLPEKAYAAAVVAAPLVAAWRARRKVSPLTSLAAQAALKARLERARRDLQPPAPSGGDDPA